MRVEPNHTVSRAVVERKRQFRKALALAEMTAEQWANKHKLSESFLSRLLAGKCVSQPTCALIDAFIAKHLGHNLRDKAG